VRSSYFILRPPLVAVAPALPPMPILVLVSLIWAFSPGLIKGRLIGLDPTAVGVIRLALAQSALRFGEFTLKSGRQSPYFFNAGNFRSGAALAALGRTYAAAIAGARVDFDVHNRRVGRGVI
jgi:hypothetical protein